MSLQVQFLTLATMFGSGVALGVIFDTYRVVGGHIRLSRWLIPLFDTAYWMIATIFVFRVLYLSNHGHVRFFVFIGLAIGISFYFALLSVWTSKFVLMLIQWIKAVIRFAKRMFRLLVITPIIYMYRLVLIFIGFLFAIAIFLYKVMVQLMYPFWWIIRKLARPVKGLFVPFTRMLQWVRKLVKK